MSREVEKSVMFALYSLPVFIYIYHENKWATRLFVFVLVWQNDER